MVSILLEEFDPELYGPFGQIIKRSEKDEILFGKAMEEFRRRIGKKSRGTHLVRSAYSIMDELAAKFIEDKEIACKAGCSLCCHQMVCCSNLEAQLILVWLEMKPDVFLSDILRSAREKALLMKNELRELIKEKHPSSWEEIEPDLRSRHLMKPCPFFDETRMLCSIYPVRPVDCRAAYVIGQPCGTSDWARSRFPKTYYAQAACDVIFEENMRIFGDKALPLFEWVSRPEFQKSF